MNSQEFPLQLDVASQRSKPRSPPQPQEYKVVSLRECHTPEPLQLCDTPDKAASYWNLHIKTHPHFTPDQEYFVVLFLNTRRRVKGHSLVAMGTLDTVCVTPREVFRAAIITCAAAIIAMHSHPSGDPTPSDADIKTTRDLVRASQLLKIELLDHVIMGLPSLERQKDWASLRELGYLYQ
jgi:DNA repair protein RadC